MSENNPTPAELMETAATFRRQYIEVNGVEPEPTSIIGLWMASAEAIEAAYAVIEQARAAVERTADHGNAALAFNELADLIATAPATVLAQVKADAWDAGYETWASAPAGDEPPRDNPYRDDPQ